MARRKTAQPAPPETDPIPARLDRGLDELIGVACDLDGLGFSAQATRMRAALDEIEAIKDDFDASLRASSGAKRQQPRRRATQRVEPGIDAIKYLPLQR